MAVNHIYKSEVSLPITYQWKCSKCGEVNRVSTTVQTFAETSLYGSNKEANAQAQREASNISETNLYKSLDALVGKSHSYVDYKRLGLNQGCEKCKHKEPWATKNTEKRNNFLMKIVFGALAFAVMGAIVFLVGLVVSSDDRARTATDFFVCLGIAAFLAACIFASIKLNIKFITKKNNEISKLPLSSRPVLVINNEPVYNCDLEEKEEEIEDTSETDKKRSLENTYNTILHLYIRELKNQEVKITFNPSFSCPVPKDEIVSFVEQLKKDPAIEYNQNDGYLSLFDASFNAGIASSYIHSKHNLPNGNLYDYLVEETRNNGEDISDCNEYFFVKYLNIKSGEAAYNYYSKTSDVVCREIEKPYIVYYTLCGLSREARESEVTAICSFVFALGFFYGEGLMEWLSPTDITEYNKTSDSKIYKEPETTDESDGSNTSSIIGVADEIKKFKELLDSDAITREEYEAKKKQLLRLL